ncbi:MAG TPA: septal ring lytic transglycosylase RlpA family protein [bacterium]|nr:septal ring lytic transglycosylase RlpA family protein [bacterium]
MNPQFLLSQVCFRVLRVFAVIALALTVGCVPIRQYVGGSGHSTRSQPDPGAGGSVTEYENPNDFKNLDKDAWKGEMEGIASWYGEEFNGRLTASGEVYDMYKMTAAHKTLPLGTMVRVTNEDNGKTIEVKINDRGPYVKGRIIDLSKTAGRAIGMREAGTAKVKLEVVRWP